MASLGVTMASLGVAMEALGVAMAALGGVAKAILGGQMTWLLISETGSEVEGCGSVTVLSWYLKALAKGLLSIFICVTCMLW